VILDKEVDNTFLHLPLNFNIISQQKTVNLQSDGNSYLEFHVPFSTKADRTLFRSYLK